MSISKENIRKLVDIVGRGGALCALDESNKIGMKDLIELAHSLGISPKSKDSKKSVALQIIQNVDKRINKTLDELKTLSKEELIKYLESVQCHQDEIIELLGSIDLKVRVKSREALIEFAAIQISSLGVFERLSEYDGKKIFISSEKEKGEE